MAKITNSSMRQITLPGAVTLAPGDSGEIDEAAMDNLTVMALIHDGDLALNNEAKSGRRGKAQEPGVEET